MEHVVPCPTPEESEEFSTRQCRILLRMTQGWTDTRIARELELSDRQVRREIDALMLALRARCRFQLAIRAYRAGLIPPGAA